MVIGIAMMAAMVPTVYGLGEASNKGSQTKEKEQDKKGQEEMYHLLTACNSPSDSQQQKAQIHNAKVYLDMDGKAYISQHQVPGMVPFHGCLYSHPDWEPGNLAGLVTVSPETPPQLRWAFLDSSTHEVKWGGAKDREGHISGPFGLHDDEGSLTLNGSRNWVAVRWASECHEEENPKATTLGLWSLYFDAGEDHSMDLPAGAEKIDIELKLVRYPQRPS